MEGKKISKESLSDRAFKLIDLIEMTNIQDSSFKIVRKKLLDLANDIKRLEE